MNKIVHKTFSASEKAMVALEALKGNLTINEITKKYGVHATQISNWKKRLKEGIIEIFSQGRQKRDLEANELVEALYKKIGQLEIELDWLKKKSELFDK